MWKNWNDNIKWKDVFAYYQDYAKHPKKPDKWQIFKTFKTPDNEEKPFNRYAFFSYLIMETSDFEPLFSDMEYLCMHLRTWTDSRISYWQRIYDVLCTDYKPLENYNRTDEEATHTGRDTDTATSTDTNSKVAGYDSGAMVDQDELNSTGEMTENLVENFTRNLHAYGNIGVMTSQQMLEQEIEVCQISMYDIMLQEFKNTFCLQVY